MHGYHNHVLLPGTSSLHSLSQLRIAAPCSQLRLYLPPPLSFCTGPSQTTAKPGSPRAGSVPQLGHFGLLPVRPLASGICSRSYQG